MRARLNGSPNNDLSGQTNIARTLERVPDIFGEVKSYPDLINPTAFEFIDHVKFQREYVCIGRGYYDLRDFRSGDTLIEQIVGSSVDVYSPGVVPDNIPKTNTSNEVTDQEARAPNENNVAMDQEYSVSYDSVNDFGLVVSPNADDWDGIEPDDTLDLIEVSASAGGAARR